MKFRFYRSEDRHEVYGSEKLIDTKEMDSFPPFGTLFWVNVDEHYRIVDYSISPDSDEIDVMMIACDDINDLKGRF